MVSDAMEIPAGCKQTEVGVIPGEWEVKEISNLIQDGSIIGHSDGNHGELYPRSSEFKENGVPYIGANDFQDGHVRFDRCKFLSPQRASQFKKGVARNGDVLFAHNATVGPVALLSTDKEIVILSTTATYFRCDIERLNNFYLSYALTTSYFVNQYSAVMAQSTRFQVPITAQRKFLLALPPLPEQKAIASALRDVDELLDAQSALVAKKRDLKTATMDELLAPKRRLPGFSGEWEETTLGDAFERVVGGGTPSRAIAEFWNGSIPWVTVKDFATFNPRSAQEHITAQGLRFSASNLIPSGVLIASTRMAVGKAVIYEVPVAINQDLKALFLKPAHDSRFLFYWFAWKAPELELLASGSTVKGILLPQLKSLDFRTPPTLAEQKAIAGVLGDMDAEIAALEAEQRKTRHLKSAMMDELLSGRTRLV